MAQTVYVIMSNDFPDSVFSDPVQAQTYVDKENNLDKQRYPHRKVFWKVEPFVIDAKAS